MVESLAETASIVGQGGAGSCSRRGVGIEGMLGKWHRGAADAIVVVGGRSVHADTGVL